LDWVNNGEVRRAGGSFGGRRVTKPGGGSDRFSIPVSPESKAGKELKIKDDFNVTGGRIS